jgi:hypothetical protein
MELYNKGYLNDVSVDIENQRALTRFLDAGKRDFRMNTLKFKLEFLVVIKLEGGNDQDLRVLDVTTSASNTTNENEDGEDDIPKQPLNTGELTPSEKTDSSTSVAVTNSKKSPESKVESHENRFNFCFVLKLNFSENEKVVHQMMEQYQMVEKRMMMLKKRNLMERMEYPMKRKKITKPKHHHKKMNLKLVKFLMYRDYYTVHCRSFSVIYPCKQPKMILKM